MELHCISPWPVCPFRGTKLPADVDSQTRMHLRCIPVRNAGAGRVREVSAPPQCTRQRRQPGLRVLMVRSRRSVAARGPPVPSAQPRSAHRGAAAAATAERRAPCQRPVPTRRMRSVPAGGGGRRWPSPASQSPVDAETERARGAVGSERSMSLP